MAIVIDAGRMVLHYRFVEKLGEGAMGLVWKAIDTTLDRDVAIKVLRIAVSHDPDRLARFEREARLLARVTHPGIARGDARRDAAATQARGREQVSRIVTTSAVPAAVLKKSPRLQAHP